MSVLAGAALMPGSGSGVRIEDDPKRVRTYLGGELIADTRRPKLVWETRTSQRRTSRARTSGLNS